MALDSIDKLVAAFSGANGNPPQPTVFNKNSMSCTTGSLVSLWTAAGFPNSGANGSATIVEPTKDTAGALFTFTNPTSPNKSYLGRLSMFSGVAATTVFVYDRLAHMGGLAGNSNTSQSINGGTGIGLVNPAAANRCAADGSDVEWFLEWYTATGVSSVTATITYTNQSGTAGRTTTLTVPASSLAGRILAILPAVGDTAIKSIQSVQLAASTGTAGNFGVTAAKRITDVPGLSSASGTQIATFNWSDLGLPQIPDDACLWLAVVANSTVTGTFQGSARLVKG